jgi:hypothetical protein
LYGLSAEAAESAELSALAEPETELTSSPLQAATIGEERTTPNNSFSLLAGIVLFLLSNVVLMSSRVGAPRLDRGR